MNFRDGRYSRKSDSFLDVEEASCRFYQFGAVKFYAVYNIVYMGDKDNF